MAPAAEMEHLIMKRTMLAVIVGPTIDPSISVFAFERENCLTSKAVMAGTPESGSASLGIESARGRPGGRAVARNGACFDLSVTPETGMRLKPAARCEDRF